MWDTRHITPKSKEEEEVALEGHDIFEWEEKQIFSFVACFCNGKIASKCGFEMHLSDALSFPLLVQPVRRHTKHFWAQNVPSPTWYIFMVALNNFLKRYFYAMNVIKLKFCQTF